MKNKRSKTILKTVKIIVSLLLCITATASMLGATLINVARDYLNSDSFEEQVDEADLNSLKLQVNGQKITVNEYVRKVAKNRIESELEKTAKSDNESFYSDAKDFILQVIPNADKYASSVLDKVVDDALTSEALDRLIKSEVMNLVDYFVNSDVDEARERLKNGEASNYDDGLRVSDGATTEEKLINYYRLYTRTLVIDTIEKASNMSADNFIVLLSRDTVVICTVIAVAALILLLLINVRTIFDSLLYGGFISFFYAAVIKFAQNKFDDMNEGLEDLVGYVFLKPLADCYSANAVGGIIIGTVLIGLFIGMVFLFKNYVNKPEEENG